MKLIFEKVFVEEDRLPNFISDLVGYLKSPAVIYLSGDLGAGKTTFVSNFCDYFQIQHVSSPTYAIHNRYEVGNVSIDHFDLYRLETEEDLQAAGFYDLMSEASKFKIIEWPERLESQALTAFGTAYWLSVKKNADFESARDYRLYALP